MPVRPHPGLEIDGFTLGEQLHKGGFATIWDVTHPLYRTPLVMKIPTIMDGYDGPTIVGFEVEQMIMPRLTGPHVPRVIGQGDFATMPYIVTERIPGTSLFQHFKRKPLPIDELIEMAARMAAAVHDIHRQHVIHLDLKPDNFLQRPSGEMVLIDYGLSRHDLLPDLLAEEFTIPMGTFPYIAPEQFLRQRGDLRSDLYALGALIYEMATGRFPFGQPEKLSGVKKRLWRDPMPPRAIRKEIPEWLQEIILRALEVDPASRYQSAAQMIFDLTHPMQVRLTDRAHKLHADPVLMVFKRWRKMRNLKAFAAPPSVSAQIDRAPILLVAVDLSPEMEALQDAIFLQVKRMLVNRPDARVACVNVIKTAMLGIDQTTDGYGTNLHVARLVALKAWADGIDLTDDRLTYTILENTDPAAAIIEHADANRVDHILMGARGHSTTRRFLGSVSAKVVAEASCSVTVIRLRDTPLAESAA
ncbi:MAG: bifunctional serine/threonine-protein kinase/universal stress protein [Cypionkella sp.]|uniref:bifunctional serine/threonine-protein kinase/universal stress protein n=1 Tax=Cypionkella sp. TaxID=2811411 RepID=UPI00271E8406|nr:bifunctional serine/threonine-protein kinase/universal stress protein [Cypionkella sp.]MDO8328173.1 bifunctional serine/threonine-protein kinase/universal stress protein [Cypionkella sp.]